MSHPRTIRKLEKSETALIHQIATWYRDEWDTPFEKTISLLKDQPEDDLLFQLILLEGNDLAGTGGVRNKVNILNIHPELGKFGPWISQLYTSSSHRRLGLGTRLLEQIEDKCWEAGIDKLYLYTFTAESLYKRCGWHVIDKVLYKNHETVVMEKALK